MTAPTQLHQSDAQALASQPTTSSPMSRIIAVNPSTHKAFGQGTACPFTPGHPCPVAAELWAGGTPPSSWNNGHAYGEQLRIEFADTLGNAACGNCCRLANTLCDRRRWQKLEFQLLEQAEAGRLSGRSLDRACKTGHLESASCLAGMMQNWLVERADSPDSRSTRYHLSARGRATLSSYRWQLLVGIPICVLRRTWLEPPHCTYSNLDLLLSNMLGHVRGRLELDRPLAQMREGVISIRNLRRGTRAWQVKETRVALEALEAAIVAARARLEAENNPA